MAVNPPIAVIRKELGELSMIAILNVFLIDLVSFFNVGKAMTTAQIAETSQIILKRYYYLKPEDFKLCFQNCKELKYGDNKLFDRLDGSIILSWIAEYCNERSDFFSGKHDKLHEQVKNIPPVAPEEAKRIYNKIMVELEKDIQKEDEYTKFKREYLLKQSKQNEANDNGKN